MKKNNIFVIAGPTGSGESAITNEVVRRFPKCIRLVTATTRKPRNHEQNGIDYYFLEKDVFQKKVATGEIIEHTFIPGRNIYYGTLKSEIEEKIADGFIIIINPDIVGARFYKKNYRAVSVFINPGSVDVVRNRLLKRQPNINKVELQKRLEQATAELKEAGNYDYIIDNPDNQMSAAIEKVITIMKKEGYELD
jgi:guanylate kinase